MILAFDVGNTNIVIGILYKEKNNFSIKAKVRFYTRTEITSDELGIFLLNFLAGYGVDKKEIKTLVFSSVVPPLDGLIKRMFQDYFGRPVLEVASGLNLGFVNRYKNPLETGSDRLVNAAYVNHFYKKNAVIVDFGTATTFCVLTEQGEYLGGPIIPGITTSLNALIGGARKLPPVRVIRKEKIVTDNTVDALESGIYFSNYYAVRGMVGSMAEEAGFEDYVTIATGGLAGVFKESGLFDYIEENMAFKGLKVIFDLNS